MDCFVDLERVVGWEERSDGIIEVGVVEDFGRDLV